MLWAQIGCVSLNRSIGAKVLEEKEKQKKQEIVVETCLLQIMSGQRICGSVSVGPIRDVWCFWAFFGDLNGDIFAGLDQVSHPLDVAGGLSETEKQQIQGRPWL